MVLLGKVAYVDLVFGNEGDKTQRRGVSQLVFEKDDLIAKVGEDVLIFALEVGLLSQASAPGSFDEENVSINFFHKTIEEFLAALYIVCSNEASIESCRAYCSSTQSLVELGNVMMFLVGIGPSLGIKVSKLFAQVSDADQDIIRHRKVFDVCDKTKQKVELLLDTLFDCYQEMKFSQRQNLIETTIIPEFHVSDLLIVDNTKKSIKGFATEVLSQVNCSVASLHLKFKHGNPTKPFIVINELNTKSLQKLLLEGSNCQLTLYSIGTFFPSLTVLSLYETRLTTDATHALQEAITSNTQIERLRVIHVREYDVPFYRVPVTGICFDLKKNKQLMLLEIRASINTMYAKITDITQCRSINDLILEGVLVQSVDMLQISLSSFTQLRNLKLIRLLSFDKKIIKMCLNLTNCLYIMHMKLVDIHVEKIEISPVSLQTLEIRKVSGSLQGLLLALLDCQYLKTLGIIGLYDIQDVDVLIDIIPNLTQVQSMAFSGRENVWDADVAQSITKMTGLEKLSISYLNMGDVALTLLPLMAQIEDVQFEKVDMTVNSWNKFLASLREIQHVFDIQLLDTNIDDEFVSALSTSPDFQVNSVSNRPYRGNDRYYVMFSTH